MYENLYKRIIDASQTKSLTFFVGAGVSKLSNAPKWSELIDAFCHSLGKPTKKYYSNDEYLSIPQMYYYSVNKDEDVYYAFINDCFGNKELYPNKVHKMLLEFEPTSFITTNFDDLLESAAAECCQTFKVIARDDEIPLTNGDRFILKLHGDLKHKNIVLKEEDYLNYSETFKLVETFLKSIFSTSTVVFIGYGLNDYNIKLILNWTKTLLKEHFNKPIFIYTDTEELDDNDLKYHESKGLHVIDYHKCVNHESPKDMDYIDRYATVLREIMQSSIFSLSGKTDIEAFEMLYSLISPLDKMKSLRVQDVRAKLHSKVIIENSGVINTSVGENILLSYYLNVLKMSNEEREKLSKDIINKFETITRVFLKAQIFWIVAADHKQYKINYDSRDVSFADEVCINFDYSGMIEYINKETSSLWDNYRKAYYLAKLNRHKESYDLFTSTAKLAYKEKDYLLYLLAQANRNILFLSMKSINGNLIYHNYYKIDEIEDGQANSDKIEQIFDTLPIEFKSQYSCFKNISSFNLLYENSYYSSVDGVKLQDAIESNVFEMGITSADKVISRINNNLHFFIGNGLYMEEFVEFKNTIRNLMSLLIYKYSTQKKKVFEESIFGSSRDNEIYLDKIDFFCLLEYFDAKKINKLLNKHDLKTIEFRDMESIEQSVRNCLIYYKTIVKSKNIVEVLACQNKIKNCLNLLRYIDISQELVDFVCDFIFKYDFRDIDISDKILFLDSQLAKRKKYSANTARIIENKLIYYLDKHISSIEKTEEFKMFSSRTGINYPNLILYIQEDSSKFRSKRLALRVSKILSKNYTQFKDALKWKYYESLSEQQKKAVVNFIKNEIKNNFDYDSFLFLVNYNIKIPSYIIKALKSYLDKKIESAKKGSPIKTSSSREPLEDLNHTGYLCLAGCLNKKQFKKYINVSLKFNFYYQYEKFDFSKFEVAWLLQMTKYMHLNVSKSPYVCKQIRSIIAEELRSGNLKSGDRKELVAILTNYYCG